MSSSLRIAGGSDPAAGPLSFCPVTQQLPPARPAAADAVRCMLAAERRLGQVLGALLGGGSLCVSLLHMSGAGAARRAKPAGLAAAEAKAPREALTEPGYAEAWPYSAEDLRRRDESSDADFYSQPRLVTHIDDAAIESLRSFCAPPDPRHHPLRPPASG